jgi:membrane complex biogenesis BtpA family protein
MDRNHLVASMFGAPRALLGVVHLEALPGTPASRHGLEAIVERAVEEARVYAAAGFHGIVIENIGDRPFLKRAVGPEVVAAMAAVGREVRRTVSVPLGVQVLAGANREALAVALACGARFVRVEGFVFGHVADEGLMESDAGELLRYRRAIGAEEVRVFADIKKKHSAHAITADVDLAATAHAAEFFLADGVIVTGTATGEPTDPGDVQAVGQAVGIPVLVGSGVTAENIGRYPEADAFIVGSSLKAGGVWSGLLDPARVQALARAFAALSRG